MSQTFAMGGIHPVFAPTSLPGVNDGVLEIRLEDQHSVIRRLEILRDGRIRYTARPTDGVSDSREERYRLELPDVEGGSWSLRGVDAAGNEVERAVPAE